MIELILMRHGKSPNLYEAGVKSDSERPIADAGRKQAKKAGKALKELESLPTLILASPLLRTRQTAEEVVESIGQGTPLKIFPALEAGAIPHELLKALEPYSEQGRLMLVGHQPDLGALASHLLFGEASGAISLKPGGMMLLELERLATGAASTLRWLLLPSQIERLS